jgi:hypothetical protein
MQEMKCIDSTVRKVETSSYLDSKNVSNGKIQEEITQ